MNTRKGVLAVVGASCLYGVLPIFSKAILNEGMNTNALVFNRFMFTMLFSLLILKALRIDMRVTKRQLIELVLAALIGYGMTASLLTLAYSLIPVGLATMFHFTNPLFVTLAMIVIFKEKATLFKGISMVCAVAGLILMADFSRLAPLGVLLAVMSGITYASYVIANKKCSFASLNQFVIVFYVGLVNWIFFGIRNALTHDLALPPTLKAWVYMVILALFCTIGALFLLTYGIRTLGASTASVLNMLEPVVSLIAGIIVYHEAVSFKSLLGCLFIVISGIVVVMDKKADTGPQS
ncbi:MAG: DMT family transporter [Solobacterium sp.]|nr:DMT family transporter [Solobacterium sp.]